MLNGSKQVKDLQARMEDDLKPMTDCDNFDTRFWLQALLKLALLKLLVISDFCSNFRANLLLAIVIQIHLVLVCAC